MMLICEDDGGGGGGGTHFLRAAACCMLCRLIRALLSPPADSRAGASTSLLRKNGFEDFGESGFVRTSGCV